MRSEEMNSEEKMRKRATEEDETHISALPDDVLCHILSFLNPKDAIQTSFLSKSFRNLWHKVPVLNLNSDDFSRLSCFDRFVNRVLTVPYLPKINSFIFSRGGRMPKNLYNKILNYVAAHEVEEFSIHIRSKDFNFWNTLYSSETLKRFELRTLGPNMKIKRPFCFRHLTMINLDFVTIDVRNPFSSCPELVSMSLTNCELGHSTTLSIVAPKLVKLKITCQWTMHFRTSVMISTPILGSFYYNGPYPLALSTSHELSHLDAVGIDVYGRGIHFLTEDKEQVASNLISMLRCFVNAKTLSLSPWAIETFTRFPSLLELESPSLIHGIRQKLSHKNPTLVKAIFKNDY